MRIVPEVLCAIAGLTLPAQAEVPAVVASIKPIHALVATAMGELGTPELIVDGTGSPHTYSLKPSDAEALEAADLVFWTGPNFELFLREALPSLAADARVVALADVPDLGMLPVRKGGAFEADGHDEPEADAEEAGHANEERAHEDEEGDLHFWLDPQNGQLMLHAIAAALAEADPDNAAAYAANAAAGAAELEALEQDLRATLAPVADQRFIVFHDAYQYFERRFGLQAAGSITVSPESMPGARRIGELRQHIGDTGIVCVFAEPQFEPSIIAAIVEGTEARAGMLDPEGAGLEPGPDMYQALLRRLADGFTDCLSGS